MGTKFPEFVDTGILKFISTIDPTVWTSIRFLCKYLSFKFQVSQEYAYKVIKDDLPTYELPGYVIKVKVKKEVAKFIMRHRRNAVKKVLGVTYIRKDMIEHIENKLK